MSIYYHPYKDASNTLRAWLAAYGIGAPVLILSQSYVSTKIDTEGNGQCIAAAFLMGLAIQGLFLLFNKIAMGYLYENELGIIKDKSCRSKVSSWYSEAFWLHILADVVSIALFTYGTYQIMKALLF